MLFAKTYGSVRLIPHMVKNMEGYIQMNPSTILTHFCSKNGRVDAPPDTNGRLEFILSEFVHLRTWDYGYMPGRRCAGFLAGAIFVEF